MVGVHHLERTHLSAFAESIAKLFLVFIFFLVWASVLIACAWRIVRY